MNETKLFSIEEKCEWLIGQRTDLLMAHRADKEIPAWVIEMTNLITAIRNDILDHDRLKAESERLREQMKQTEHRRLYRSKNEVDESDFYDEDKCRAALAAKKEEK